VIADLRFRIADWGGLGSHGEPFFREPWAFNCRFVMRISDFGLQIEKRAVPKKYDGYVKTEMAYSP
jgi:hypothetical protein